jgi:hypothetical protein
MGRLKNQRWNSNRQTFVKGLPYVIRSQSILSASCS